MSASWFKSYANGDRNRKQTLMLGSSDLHQCIQAELASGKRTDEATATGADGDRIAQLGTSGQCPHRMEVNERDADT
jgi:hypothetical protein